MELIPCWNGTMERQGTAAGLSSYSGSSSLRNYTDAEPELLERADCARIYTRRLPLTDDQIIEARMYLRLGLGIRTTAQAMRVHFRTIRALRDRMKADGSLVRKSQ
jgi:hypothetical protein